MQMDTARRGMRRWARSPTRSSWTTRRRGAAIIASTRIWYRACFSRTARYKRRIRASRMWRLRLCGYSEFSRPRGWKGLLLFKRVGLCLVLLILLLTPGCSQVRKKVIVIGVDGMDPGFVERHWKDLPNLAMLRREGSFSRLQTTTPPQSPVAWSTFITGLDPDEHGIFDFVHR